MIINTVNRTDIPAFFSKWFYNRIQAGFVLVRNPYYPQQVRKYYLTPDLVDCLAFSTKNPIPMLDRIDEIGAFKQFWFVTLTPYQQEIEPHVPPKEKIIDAFKKLSDRVGIEAISWRYDPIFISEDYSLDDHIACFEKMAQRLAGYTDHCVISFIDLYQKTKLNFPGIKPVAHQERLAIGKAFVEIGRANNLQIRSCCEGEELAKYGVDTGGCMTKVVLERAIGSSLRIPKNRDQTREGCECLLGNDIGVYNTCTHGCRYCYANHDEGSVRQNRKNHDPTSPFLIGSFLEGDIIKEAKQQSYRDGQLSFL